MEETPSVPAACPSGVLLEGEKRAAHRKVVEPRHSHHYLVCSQHQFYYPSPRCPRLLWYSQALPCRLFSARPLKPMVFHASPSPYCWRVLTPASDALLTES